MNEQLTQYIDVIAAKLGVAAEHVYGVLIKQKIAEGIADTVLGIVFLAVFITLITVVVNAYTKSEYEKEGEGNYAKSIPSNTHAKVYEFIDEVAPVFFTIYIPVQIFLGIFSVACLYLGILALINPEYYAIKELLNVVKGGN